MNDEIAARGGGDEHRRRPYEELACTMAFEASASAGRLLARESAATSPRDLGVRVNAPGNLWQVTHTHKIDRRAGDRR
jgi:hypothetical protein